MLIQHWYVLLPYLWWRCRCLIATKIDFLSCYAYTDHMSCGPIVEQPKGDVHSRGDVDSQLGLIHRYVRGYCPPGKSYYVSHDDDDTINLPSDIVIVSHVFIEKLAQEARDFLQNIPEPRGDDPLISIDNPPLKKVVEAAQSKANCYEALTDADATPDEWYWEHYKEHMWRAVPRTLAAFCRSPIFTLLDALDEFWRSSSSPIDSTRSTTLVIQRTMQNGYIAKHNDAWKGRALSFTYYLTPYDWNPTDDGGVLRVVPESAPIASIDITPCFNTMVYWKMSDDYCPEHEVTKVTTNKSRIALTGFFV